MHRFFVSACFIYSLIFASVTSVAADEDLCAAQAFQGKLPALLKDGLEERTTRLCFTQLALLHSGLSRGPLWSAEHLTAGRVYEARMLMRPRSTAFHSEQSVPRDDRSELGDYKRSGFDRGHMAPNGDMSTEQAQAESFTLANIVPQNRCNNGVLWEGIESAVRNLTSTAGEVYVVTGPAFIGEVLESLKGRVLIPSHIYKAIYIPSRNAAGAYLAPNDDSQTWTELSIDKLAEKIGIDPFPALGVQVKKTVASLPQPVLRNSCRVQTSDAGDSR